MPEHILPESPRDFLARHGEEWKVLTTFQSAVEVIAVTQTTFIRAAGSEGSGKWWMRMDTFEQIMADVQALPEWPNERRNLLQRQIRALMAVCVNWSDLSAFWRMHVRDQPLVGLRGLAKQQAVWDKHSARRPMPSTLGNATERKLPGGGLQYFFPKIPQEYVPIPHGAPKGRTL